MVSALCRVLEDCSMVFIINIGEGRKDWKMLFTVKNSGLHGTTLSNILSWYQVKRCRKDWDVLAVQRPTQAKELFVDKFLVLHWQG
jgi:hypothetical protein